MYVYVRVCLKKPLLFMVYKHNQLLFQLYSIQFAGLDKINGQQQ